MQRIYVIYLLSLSILFYGCYRPSNTSTEFSEGSNKLIIVNSRLQDTVYKRLSSRRNQNFSDFSTLVEAHYYLGDALVDSLIEPDHAMMSWYTAHNDTVNMVAHLGFFEPEGLLVRFIDGKPAVYFLRAPHEGQKFFKLEKSGQYTNQTKVQPTRYLVKLSAIPDPINKPVIYGYIDMESGDYYENRDTVDQKLKVQIRFFFRSQFRNFNYH
jgi:hypothetical protein